MNEISRGMSCCGECGMSVEACEYHPFAACLMFKQCQNSKTVRDSLKSVAACGANNTISAIKELIDNTSTWSGDSVESVVDRLQKLIDEAKK